MSQVENLEQMLAQGQDNSLLRFGLGNAYMQAKQFEQAIEHLQAAVSQDRDYSAAWKLLGRALSAAERYDEAIDAYRTGIEVAEQKGDLQAAKEMGVFVKRLEKSRQ